MDTQKRQTPRRLIGIDQKTAPFGKTIPYCFDIIFQHTDILNYFFVHPAASPESDKKAPIQKHIKYAAFFLALFYIYLKYHY